MSEASLQNLKIAIITYNWPPRNAIGTHRPLAWARYFSDVGAHVTVLTAKKQPFDKPLDFEAKPIRDLALIETAPSGVTKFLGALVKSAAARKLGRMAKNRIEAKLSVVSDPRASWRRQSLASALQLGLRSDVVISTFGPTAAHLIAYDMKVANPALFWIADYRDLWFQSARNSETTSLKNTATITHRNTVGEKADLITAVSRDIVLQLEQLLRREAVYSPNGFDTEDRQVTEALSKRPEKPAGPLRIVHTGTLYEDSRDPSPLLECLISLEQEGSLTAGDVTVDFYGSRVSLANRLAKHPEYFKFIRVMGHRPRDETLAVQRNAGLLLLLESSEPEARGVLTGKVFEYLTTGRPILCIGSSPEYEIGQLLAATGTGRAFGPSEMATFASVFLQTIQGEGLFTEYRANIPEVMKYSRKTQSASLGQLLAEKIVARDSVF